MGATPAKVEEGDKTCPAKVEHDHDTSEDELAQPLVAHDKRLQQSRAYETDFKTEKQKKENDSSRRSMRTRKSNLLESDTVLARSSRRMTVSSTPRLDTARNRLRNDIAHTSKAKANNFMVANKDYFLPLLPPNNHISKLVAKQDTKSIIEYKELRTQPEGVTAVMKPYQLSGLSYLVYLYNNGLSGILGDEMGLGKTLQTLSLFQYLEELDRKNEAQSEELRPYLVICPLSVLSSWITEAEKWVPELKVLRFHGATSERQRLKRVALGVEDMRGQETTRARDRKASRKAGQKVGRLTTGHHDSASVRIIVTTYETFQAEQSWFKHSFVWRYVVLDEGHKIKAGETQISASLRNITSEYRLILTGTPLQNNLVELWSLLAWLYPEVFTNGTDKLFKESFDLNKGKVNRTTMDDARHLLELIMLRRMKDTPSVNLGLPPKEEVLLYVPLTLLQKFWYTRILTRIDEGMFNELFADGKSKEKVALEEDRQEKAAVHSMENLNEGEAIEGEQHDWQETTDLIRKTIANEQVDSAAKGAWHKLMNLVMQLRKCCSHPYLLPGAAPEPYYFGNHIIRASGKFILLEKLLRHSIFEQGKNVLIFSGFTRTLDFCEDLLAIISEQEQRFRYLRLDGSTARARRNLDIRLLNRPDSDYKVMLLSTRAGGLGINLTSAEDVIFLDEDWNPQITLQAEARAHRIGQTKKVTVYKLCTQGTVEEQMLGRIRKKLYLSAKITESMQQIHGKPASRAKGRQSINDDMPQMDTSQLKKLVRRGAQTLSHPELDVNEMISWDLDTMMAKCRDKPADAINIEASTANVDEEKWLSVMERVECAVFDGKRYERQLGKETRSKPSIANILPDSITRADRRKGKNTTVMHKGYAINKESMNCADWEAVPTMAGKDPRLADVQRKRRRVAFHEEHCLACFNDVDASSKVECKSCPRTYHFDCLDDQHQSKAMGFRGFYCSQHNCSDCGKTTSDAGGLVYRCRWCPGGFCEDCLDWDRVELIGENLPEFEVHGEGPAIGGFYIKCSDCIVKTEKHAKERQWMRNRERGYRHQHNAWREQRRQAQNQLEQHATAQAIAVDAPTDQQVCITIEDDDDVPSPPSLTDTSAPTPALSSRVGTPKLVQSAQPMIKGRKRTIPVNDPETVHVLKKSRVVVGL